MLILMVIAAALVVGAVALAVGLRGRRVDDHPTCRACGFDLVGRGATAAAVLGAPCSECGKPIASETDVRVGTRVRRRGVVILGAALLTLALLIAGPFVIVPLAGQTASKPTWLLLVEAEYGTTKLQETAADELMNRHVAGKLPAAEGLKLVTLAARVHANTNVAFTKIWREIMNDDVLFAMLPQSTRDAAAVSGVEPFLKWRQRIRSGNGVPLAFGVALTGDERVLQADQRVLGIRRIVWRVSRATGEVVTGGIIERQGHRLTLMDTPNSSTWQTECPKVDLEPGAYVLDVEVDACVVPRSVITVPARGPLIGPAVPMTGKGEFEVLDEGKASVEVVEDTRLLEKVRSSVRLGPKHVVTQPAGSMGQVQIRYDVVFQDDGRSFENDLHTSWGAELWSADGSAPVEGLTQTGGAWMPFNGSLQGGTIWMQAAKRVEPGKYRLRLRPDVAVAETTEHITKILGGEMEFEVELEEWPKAVP